MIDESHSEISAWIISESIRLLSDGIPRSARILSQELHQLGIYVDKSQVNRILYNQGKPWVLYDRQEYSYYLAETTGSDANSSKHATTLDKSRTVQSVIPSVEQIPEHLAQQYIESLRNGIAPAGDITYFTAGLQAEISELVSLLTRPSARIKLLKANYGSGKTHLLRLVQEEALKQNFAVSLVTLDAKSGVRFSKLDEIFGAITRNLRLPDGMIGIEALFDSVIHADTPEAHQISWQEICTDHEAPQLEHALLWWAKSNDISIRDALVAWMNYPQTHSNQKQQVEIYRKILGVNQLSRTDEVDLLFIRKKGTFNWRNAMGYTRTWNALSCLHKLTQFAGMNGLILLFDEFEDIVSNMTKPQQIHAFEHLFSFRQNFPGLAIFAVTPDFVENCRDLLWRKSIDNFMPHRFEKLPFLEISPLTNEDLFEFSNRLLVLYEHAYQFQFPERDSILNKLRLESVAASYSPDRARDIAKRTTRLLDGYLE